MRIGIFMQATPAKISVMQPPVLFEEVQQFRQKWLEGLMLLINSALVLLYFFDVATTDHADADVNIGLISGVVICGSVTFLLRRLKLITQVTAEGVQVRFSPVQRRFQLYRWDDIEQLFIRTYQPLTEYGGWGLRLGPSGSAYNVSGNIGLQLVLRGNYKILIGTTNPDGLIDVIRHLGRI